MSNDKIVEQLEKVREIVRNLCKERRCPSMSIPVNSSDEDVVIYYAINAAIEALSVDKITGWVAWHPEKGIYEYMSYGKLVGNTFEDALDELIADYDLDAQYMSEYRDNMDNPRFATMTEWLHHMGWQIRPVELRFIDEEEKQNGDKHR